MSKKKQKKKTNILHSVFYLIYFGLIFLFAIALTIGLVYVNNMMTDFESSRPKYAAQKGGALFEQANYAAIYDLDTATQLLSANETKDDYVAFMNSYVSGKTLTWNEVFSGSDTEKKYCVYLDGQKFAWFTMTTTGEKTEHGYDTWKINSITTNVLASSDYTLTAPADSTVTVNGRTLTDADAVETGIKTFSDGMLPDGVTSPTLTKYAFSTTLGTPQINVIGRDGNAQTLEDDGNGNYSCGLVMNNELKQAYEEPVVQVAKKLAKYTSEDLSRNSMEKSTASGSPAYKNVHNFNNTWCPSHTGTEFQDMTTDNYYQYSDKCFSCDVTFKYIIHYKSTDDATYDTKYTFYFVKNSGTYELYNFTMG